MNGHNRFNSWRASPRMGDVYPWPAESGCSIRALGTPKALLVSIPTPLEGLLRADRAKRARLIFLRRWVVLRLRKIGIPIRGVRTRHGLRLAWRTEATLRWWQIGELLRRLVGLELGATRELLRGAKSPGRVSRSGTRYPAAPPFFASGGLSCLGCEAIRASVQGTCGNAPNDPKLSDGGGWRDGCAVGERRRQEAASVTAGAVRCSAWLGDVGFTFRRC